MVTTGGINPERSGPRRIWSELRVSFLRARGTRIGAGARFDRGVRIFVPKSVHIGKEVEVLRNSTIDGSSGPNNDRISIGDQVRIKENVWIAAYGGQIQIGQGSLIGRNCIIHGHGNVSIGEFTMIAPSCMIYSNSHVTWLGGLYQTQGFVKRETVIGRNVWLGAGVIVLAGAVVPDDCIVAAGSIVRGSLEPGYLYGGNPCKKIAALSDLDGTGEVVHWSGLPDSFPESEAFRKGVS
jgi:virginiamycin A acetyltransferase